MHVPDSARAPPVMASFCWAAQPDGEAGAYWAGVLRGALFRLATAADPLFPWLERELGATAAASRLRPISGLSTDEVMPCLRLSNGAAAVTIKQTPDSASTANLSTAVWHTSNLSEWPWHDGHGQPQAAQPSWASTGNATLIADRV